MANMLIELGSSNIENIIINLFIGLNVTVFLFVILIIIILSINDRVVNFKIKSAKNNIKRCVDDNLKESIVTILQNGDRRIGLLKKHVLIDDDYFQEFIIDIFEKNDVDLLKYLNESKLKRTINTETLSICIQKCLLYKRINLFFLLISHDSIFRHSIYKDHVLYYKGYSGYVNRYEYKIMELIIACNHCENKTMFLKLASTNMKNGHEILNVIFMITCNNVFFYRIPYIFYKSMISLLDTGKINSNTLVKGFDLLLSDYIKCEYYHYGDYAYPTIKFIKHIIRTESNIIIDSDQIIELSRKCFYLFKNGSRIGKSLYTNKIYDCDFVDLSKLIITIIEKGLVTNEVKSSTYFNKIVRVLKNEMLRKYLNKHKEHKINTKNNFMIKLKNSINHNRFLRELLSLPPIYKDDKIIFEGGADYLSVVKLYQR